MPFPRQPLAFDPIKLPDPALQRWCPGATKEHNGQSLEHLLQVLPSNIWHKILKYDIGRMLYVMKATSQISALDCISILGDVPEHRFSDKIVTLHSSLVRIHLVDIGGRTYITNFSDARSGPWTLKEALRRIVLMCMPLTLVCWIFPVYARRMILVGLPK